MAVEAAVGVGVFRNARDLKLNACDDCAKHATTTIATKHTTFDLKSIFVVFAVQVNISMHPRLN
tara:strand:+ start:186 stop:377 length:192 start_codon:yes stop_codon:yes gene_type:complete